MFFFRCINIQGDNSFKSANFNILYFIVFNKFEYGRNHLFYNSTLLMFHSFIAYKETYLIFFSSTA